MFFFLNESDWLGTGDAETQWENVRAERARMREERESVRAIWDRTAAFTARKLCFGGSFQILLKYFKALLLLQAV